jgi:hypothetical protein
MTQTDKQREYTRDWQARYRERDREGYNAGVRARRAGPAGDRIRRMARERAARQRAKVKAGLAAPPVRDLAKDRESYMLRRHGISRADFAAMLEAQGGLCYLCGDPVRREGPNGPDKAAIEHDHQCCPRGRSCPACRRGISCTRCNLAVGHALDSPARLRLIADRLEAVMAERAI